MRKYAINDTNATVNHEETEPPLPILVGGGKPSLLRRVLTHHAVKDGALAFCLLAMSFMQGGAFIGSCLMGRGNSAYERVLFYWSVAFAMLALAGGGIAWSTRTGRVVVLLSTLLFLALLWANTGKGAPHVNRPTPYFGNG